MAKFADLPPELLDHITSYLPTASSVSELSRTSKSLKQAVEKDGWATFNRTRFPSLQTPHPSDKADLGYHKDVARTLTTLSRSWDRRALLARYIEPYGDITSYPDKKKLEKWKRPRGQTIGFTPQLDSCETVASRWSDRNEVVVLSAGAEICVRESRSGRRKSGSDGMERLHKDARWMTYRKPGALEGKDDITSLLIVRPREGDNADEELSLVTGTANGTIELQTLPLPFSESTNIASEDMTRVKFQTEGLPVRSTSLLRQYSQPSLLAASLGERRICLYSLEKSEESGDTDQSPLSRLDIPSPPSGTKTYRAWSTNFLSSSHLAVGLGPSEDPVHIYSVSPSGISADPLRKFSLQNDLDKLEGEITLAGFSKKSTSSVYPIVPLPSPSGGSGDGSVFLSGAYDGITRLHDLRSDRQVEQAYKDPADDSSIYSLLPRGRETLVVGTSRHSLLKFFDLRMGAKCYSYLDAANTVAERDVSKHNSKDWNLFLKPNSATYPGRGGGNNWARRSAESSIYSLTSPSSTSPHIYAGVENAVVEIAFTSLLDERPDPAFFDHNPTFKNRNHHQWDSSGGIKAGEILSLAMYEPESVNLISQRGVGEMRRLNRGVKEEGWKRSDCFLEGLDERWKLGTS